MAEIMHHRGGIEPCKSMGITTNPNWRSPDFYHQPAVLLIEAEIDEGESGGLFDMAGKPGENPSFLEGGGGVSFDF